MELEYPTVPQGVSVVDADHICGKTVQILMILINVFSIHLCVTHLHTQEGRADAFLRDVEEAVAEIKKNPQQELDGKVSFG